jgi:competence protein ComEA
VDNLAYLRWRLGGIAALLFIGALVFYVSKQGSYVPSPEAVEAARNHSGGSTTVIAPTTTTVPEVVVDVAGAVGTPGVHTLAAGSRVGDAISAAGGLTDDADRERLNLAERIADGQRIYVLKVGQTAPAAIASTNGSPEAGGAGGPVDLNTASASQLDALPGVGPATAQAIISYRSEHGPFASVDQLASVKGIGPAKMAQLKDLVRV